MEWERAESPYLLKDQSLKSIIKVKAVDKAGNEKIVKVAPFKKIFPYWIIIFLIGITIIYFIAKWQKEKTQVKKHE